MADTPFIYAIKEANCPWRDMRMYTLSVAGGRLLPVTLTAKEINDAQVQGASLKLMALRKAHYQTGYPIKYRGRLYSTEQGDRKRRDLEQWAVQSRELGRPTARPSQDETAKLVSVDYLPDLVLADF